MKKIAIMALSIGVMALGLYFVDSNDKYQRHKFLESYQMDQMKPAEMIQYLDGNDIKPYQLQASMDGQNIYLEDGQSSYSFSYKDDAFYLSFAPYQDETHPCYNHVLTGCQGEMINTLVDVIVEDNDGNIILEESVKTGHNGFAGIFLPRNIKGKITVKYDGKMAVSEFSTGKNDGTCLTTLELI